MFHIILFFSKRWYPMSIILKYNSCSVCDIAHCTHISLSYHYHGMIQLKMHISLSYHYHGMMQLKMHNTNVLFYISKFLTKMHNKPINEDPILIHIYQSC